MIDLAGYDEVGQSALPAGGYIGKIIAVRFGTFQDGTSGIFFDMDIVEGEFSSHFRRETMKFQRVRHDTVWSSNGTIKLPLKEDGKIHWRLQKFIECVRKSNDGLTIVPNTQLDERSLVGKICGIVVALKEDKKLKRDGNHFTNAFIYYALPVDDIRSGNFTVPEIKRLGLKPVSTEAEIYSVPASTKSSSGDFVGEQIDIEDPPF